MHGLLTALHIQLDHITSHQLKLVVRRFFYGAIDDVNSKYHQCASLRNVPHAIVEQSTGDPPYIVGVTFAADIAKRALQLIPVARECSTSYTFTCLVEDERHETLRSALIRLCIELRPLDGPFAFIRKYPAPGFTSLVDDKLLIHHRLGIEVGRVKNINKNTVAKKSIRELDDELLRQKPMGGAVAPISLAVVTARLNAGISNRGLSARELLMQRDQFNN